MKYYSVSLYEQGDDGRFDSVEYFYKTDEAVEDIWEFGWKAGLYSRKEDIIGYSEVSEAEYNDANDQYDLTTEVVA